MLMKLCWIPSKILRMEDSVFPMTLTNVSLCCTRTPFLKEELRWEITVEQPASWSVSATIFLSSPLTWRILWPPALENALSLTSSKLPMLRLAC
jgi:hypothetical protein